MSRILFLDSGPLGLLTHPQRSVEVIAVADWLSQCLLNESRVIVPAIVYYEVRRELLRVNQLVGLARLDAFLTTNPGRYLPLSDRALRLAAELWAKARPDGQPTADAKALDSGASALLWPGGNRCDGSDDESAAHRSSFQPRTGPTSYREPVRA